MGLLKNLFGGRKTEGNTRKSFKKQALEFWAEFEKEEANIRQLMKAKTDPNTLVKTMSEILKTAFTDVPFEMGINKEDKHELILSPNGNRILLIQILYLLRYKPDHLDKHWNFYSSKPAHGYEGMELGMYGLTIPASDFSIYTNLNEETKIINIEVYAPILKDLGDNEKYTALFIMLDLFIGELYTMEYIGTIDFINNKKNDEFESIPLFKLKSYIEYLINEHDWEKTKDITKQYTGYRANATENSETLREDVFIGSTSCFEIIRALGQDDIFPIKALEEDGVHMAYIYYDNSTVASENMVPQRAEIEDHLDEIFEKKGIAQLIGGATGNRNSYMDFIIYDLESFIEISKEEMKKYNFNSKGIGFFQSQELDLKF